MASAVHLVMLDNGRSRMYQDSDLPNNAPAAFSLRSLRTIAPSTPIGGHAYGSVYPGPVGGL